MLTVSSRLLGLEERRMVADPVLWGTDWLVSYDHTYPASAVTVSQPGLMDPKAQLWPYT